MCELTKVLENLESEIKALQEEIANAESTIKEKKLAIKHLQSNLDTLNIAKKANDQLRADMKAMQAGFEARLQEEKSKYASAFQRIYSKSSGELADEIDAEALELEIELQAKEESAPAAEGETPGHLQAAG